METKEERVLRLLPVMAVVLAVLAAACSGRAEKPRDDHAVGATPSPPQVASEFPLHDARLDLAERLGVDPLQVRLLRLTPAGWDGCLGVAAPGAACPELFVAGYIAWFEVRGEQYRYHIGGGKFVAASFADVPPDDGSPVPPEIAPDLTAALAEYAARDLGLRLGVGRDEVRVAAVVPVTFPDLCLGFPESEETACAEAIAEGAIVFLEHAGSTYRYHVAPSAGLRATNFETGVVTVEPDADLYSVQPAMRQDLASRLGVGPDAVQVVSFRLVTWRDGCLGVHRPGEACTQALVDGFLAELAGPDGRVYRYPGAGDHFIAASFESGAVISDPLPREP